MPPYHVGLAFMALKKKKGANAALKYFCCFYFYSFYNRAYATYACTFYGHINYTLQRAWICAVSTPVRLISFLFLLSLPKLSTWVDPELM